MNSTETTTTEHEGGDPPQPQPQPQPEAEAETKAEAEPNPRRESSSGVIAIALGFAVIAFAVFSLFTKGVVPVDGAARLEERFTVQGETPFGFVVHDATSFPGGEVMVALTPADGPLGDPPLPPLDPEQGDGETAEAAGAGSSGSGGGGSGSRGGGQGEWTDWTKAEVGEEGTLPVEAAFVWYPRKLAEGVLRRQFVQVRYRDLKSLRGKGDSVPVDAGRIDWGPYEAGYVQMRHFEKEEGRPVFHDTVRVNLTLGSDCCVLYLRWGRGLPGSADFAKDVLAVYGPPE